MCDLHAMTDAELHARLESAEYHLKLARGARADLRVITCLEDRVRELDIENFRRQHIRGTGDLAEAVALVARMNAQTQRGIDMLRAERQRLVG